MKVAFISRATIFTSPGGDTRQMELTAHYLRKKGVVVDLFRSDENIVYGKYDLLHFFNIIRPADIIGHVRKSKLPYVVSTIFVEYGKTGNNDKGLMAFVKGIFKGDALEYIKVLARAVKNGEKIVGKAYLWMGHRKAIQYVAKNAACLLPNSESEYKRFVQQYGVNTKYHVVPNGIDEQIAAKEYPYSKQYENAILCMGRIEGRKNQLALIRALNNTPHKLYIHGKPSPNTMHYYQQCVKEAAPNVFIGDFLEEDALYTAYSNAKVHVLPSYFETTGLSSLEAAVMGCNIVVTDRGDTKDYFGDYAWYCDPEDVQSIRAAVDSAYSASYNEEFREYILSHYTWEQAAVETLKAYSEVIG